MKVVVDGHLAHLLERCAAVLSSDAIDDEPAVLGGERELACNAGQVVGEVDDVAVVAELPLARQLEH